MKTVVMSCVAKTIEQRLKCIIFHTNIRLDDASKLTKWLSTDLTVVVIGPSGLFWCCLFIICSHLVSPVLLLRKMQLSVLGCTCCADCGNLLTHLCRLVVNLPSTGL